MIPALFHERHVAAVTVVTALDMARIAARAQSLGEIPRDVPGWGENPAYPWEPNVCPPPVDCAILDAARTPRQEKAA